jgi:hypothetical protein
MDCPLNAGFRSAKTAVGKKSGCALGFISGNFPLLLAAKMSYLFPHE